VTPSVSFSLPFPPSVNGLFAGKARRYPSKAYKAWREAARPHVPGVLVPCPYVLSLVFDRPDRRARDLGNLEKAVSDLLVERGVVIDDSCCERLELAWSGEEPRRDPIVKVTVTAVARRSNDNELPETAEWARRFASEPRQSQMAALGVLAGLVGDPETFRRLADSLDAAA